MSPEAAELAPNGAPRRPGRKPIFSEPMKRVTYSIPHETDRGIRALVAAGKFETPNQAVRALLREGLDRRRQL